MVMKMLPCGRIRKEINNGWTDIVDGELVNMRVAVLKLENGQKFSLDTQDREYAIVLIRGTCVIQIGSEIKATMGPRENPYEHKPYAAFVTREEKVLFVSQGESYFGIGSSLATKKMNNKVITPEDVREDIRGADNWSRLVRRVCWSDNTEGNMLLAGETCTPSGNWSTIPPHRHQVDTPGEEAPYEEAYLFQFSHPQGYGLIWTFDDDGLDQAFSLRENDVAYNRQGYHPVVCSPGTMLYHLTLMAGPRRLSQARIHKQYQYIMEEKDLANQYTPGSKK